MIKKLSYRSSEFFPKTYLKRSYKNVLIKKMSVIKTPQMTISAFFNKVSNHSKRFFMVLMVLYERYECLDVIGGLIFENGPKFHRFTTLSKWLNWVKICFTMIFWWLCYLVIFSSPTHFTKWSQTWANLETKARSLGKSTFDECVNDRVCK